METQQSSLFVWNPDFRRGQLDWYGRFLGNDHGPQRDCSRRTPHRGIFPRNGCGSMYGTVERLRVQEYCHKISFILAGTIQRVYQDGTLSSDLDSSDVARLLPRTLAISAPLEVVVALREFLWAPGVHRTHRLPDHCSANCYVVVGRSERVEEALCVERRDRSSARSNFYRRGDSGLGGERATLGDNISRVVGIGVNMGVDASLFVFTFRHPRKADLLKFGSWLYGGSLMSLLIVRCSDVILATYMGTVALAVYSAAMQVPTILQRVFEAMRPALLGYVAAYRDCEASQQTETIRIVTAVLAVAATLLMAISSPLMTMLYSEEYQEGIPIMRALSVWIAFALVNYFYSIVLIGTGRPKSAFVLTVPQLIVILVSTPLLIPHYEGLGAAMALIATAFLGNVVGAKLIAGTDTRMWYAILLNFVRAAIPVLLFLNRKAPVKLSFSRW